MIWVDPTVLAFLVLGSLLGCCGLFWAAALFVARLLGLELVEK